MAFRPSKGQWIQKKYAKTASTTFTYGDLVSLAAGYLTTATAQSTKHLGIILTAVTSGDSDFASTTRVPVAVPLTPSCEFEADVTGTLATTDVGSQFDLSTAGLVNQDGTTYKVVTCKGFISTAKGYFSLNSNMDWADTTWD